MPVPERPAGSAADYTDAVLDVVERIPRGRVMTYGSIAEYLGRGGPRQVGWVMARDGSAVCWWRVVKANGALVAHLMIEAQQHWHRERTPLRRGLVDVRRALWWPEDDQPAARR